MSTDANNGPRCNFAFAGTYGHECGAPAEFAAVMKSDSTKSGLYYGKRCKACAQIKGGENSRVMRFEALDLSKHRNEWK